MTLSPVPASVCWTREPWGAALRCRPLEAIAQHLFTTRQLQLPSAEAWQTLAPSLGVETDRFLTLNQVHGREIVAIHRGIEPRALRSLQDHRPDADGFVSGAPDVALVIRVADCLPVFMADRRTGVVAAVHVGWRGTAARAAVAARRECGSRPADLVVAIGPAIGACC